MKRMLTVVIDAGADTCASEPGVFCSQLRTSMRGVFTCQLFFGKELRDEHGQLSGEGWLQRLDECKTAER